MYWSILNSKSEYNKAMERVEELSSNVPGVNSPEGRELMLLGFLIQEYEDKNFSIQYPDPIQAIKTRMEQLGLSVADLAEAFGDRGTASKVLSKQRTLSINMVRSLSKKLSLPAELLIQPIRDTARTKMSLAAEPRARYKKVRKAK